MHTKILVVTTLNGEKSRHGKYQIRKKDIRHNIFLEHREIFTIDENGETQIAVVSFQPLSQILPLDSAHLKVINKFLYQDGLKEFVNELLIELDLKFKNYSRLDIAADFKQFYKHSCPNFIKLFINRKVLKLKSTSFHLDGHATRSMPIHYLRFGSKYSDLQFYIYNKSKELRDKTNKPYIIEKWERSGLKPNQYDVWRIEFSLKPSQFGLVDKETGEANNFETLDVLLPENTVELFYSLLLNHAVFVYNDGQVKKQRMKRVELLKVTDYRKIYQKVSFKETSNRMDKVFIKMLDRVNNEWRTAKGVDVSLKDALHQFVERKDLRDWYEKQIGSIEMEFVERTKKA